MKIRILEPTGIWHDGVRYEHDEVREVPENVARYFLGNGWAEDVAGVVPTGERDLSPKRIDPESVRHDQGVTSG